MDVINIIVLSISLSLESYLLYLLSRRKVWSHFPLFFIFALAAAPATLARLLTTSHYSAYFYVFWSTDLALLILSLIALHEVFHWVYEAFYVFWWFRLLYFGTIACVLALSARNSLLNPPVQAHPVVSLILSVGVAVNLLQGGIAALFAALAGPLGVPFRRYAFGIVAGFAASAIGPFIGYFARSVFGTRLETFARYTSAVAYILALLIWVAAFSGTEPDENAWKAPLSPEEMLRTVRSYLRALGLGRNNEP
jgi:hypothetical protein